MRSKVNAFARIGVIYKAATVCLLLFLLASGNGQGPPTFAEALTAHGIGLTSTDLIKALKNPERDVRGLAAAQLAELKSKEVLPLILRAATVEPDLTTKVNIAAAATWLNSSEGANLLKAICVDPNLPPYPRQQAARNLFDKGDHACFQSVADMMLPQNTSDVRIGAAYLLTQLHDRSAEESALVLKRLLPGLRAQEIHLRLQTCITLRWLNDPAALSSLRQALAVEQEASVRSTMTSTIDILTNAKP